MTNAATEPQSNGHGFLGECGLCHDGWKKKKKILPVKKTKILFFRRKANLLPEKEDTLHLEEEVAPDF